MTAREFCYWLQGYFELNGAKEPLNAIQTAAVKSHLDMVFRHEIDPSLGTPEPLTELRKAHEAPSPHPIFDPHNTKLMC